MTQRPSHSGFEPRTRDPERRDFFDLRRRLAKIEGDPNGNGSPFGDEVFIGPADPGAASGYELWYDTDANPAVPWIAVSFENSWANAGGSDQVCQYRKIGDIVHLRGVMRRNPVTFGQTAFTLPVGYRPPSGIVRHNLVAMSTPAALMFARADLNANGTYVPWALGSGSDAGYWPLDFQFSVTA